MVETILFFIFAGLVIWFVVKMIKFSSKVRKENKQKFNDSLVYQGFKVDKELNQNGYGLYVDNTNKKWCITTPFNPCGTFFKFSDLIDFELFEDGHSIIKGNRGSTIAGTLAFGLVGGLIGASGSKKIDEKCNKLQIRIRVNDLQAPEIVINYLMLETKKDSFIYKTSFDQAKEMAATLSYIQNNSQDDTKAE